MDIRKINQVMEDEGFTITNKDDLMAGVHYSKFPSVHDTINNVDGLGSPSNNNFVGHKGLNGGFLHDQNSPHLQRCYFPRFYWTSFKWK